MSSTRRPGAPTGNHNALKHGFYTRRLKKRDLTGVESTDASGLVEEIALIRIFTRRLVESCLPDADFYELADILRILCLASTTITRLTRTQYLLSTSDTGFDDDLAEAIRQVNLEFRSRTPPYPQDTPAVYPSSPPSVASLQPLPPDDYYRGRFLSDLATVFWERGNEGSFYPKYRERSNRAILNAIVFSKQFLPRIQPTQVGFVVPVASTLVGGSFHHAADLRGNLFLKFLLRVLCGLSG